MRFRSSHFVFLVLLLCAVEVRCHVGLDFMGDNFAEVLRTGSVPGQRVARSIQRSNDGTLPAGCVETHGLKETACAAHKTVWMVRRPALAAIATNTHTGLLRA